MIAKTECQFCGKIHNVRFGIDPDNFLEECNDDQDYVISIFKCLVFPDVQQPSDGNHTVRDAKHALEELEKDFFIKNGFSFFNTLLHKKEKSLLTVFILFVS